MNTQKKIILSLVIVWVILLILFGFVHSGFLFGGKVKVYFFQSQDNNLYLVSVEKKIKQLMPEKSEKIRFVIEKLIRGPDQQESANGFISCVPAETKLLDVRLEENIIYLDFDETVETGGGIKEIRGRLSQIVYTATQFDPDAGVKLLINGKEIKSFSGEGITEVENPMYRKDFFDFIKGEKNETKDTSSI